MIDTQKLRQRILDLAIRGKLVPQDPNDEPASVLLDRIRAEKKRLIAEGKIKRPKTKSSTKSLSSGKKSTTDTPHYVPFEIPKSWVWCHLDDCCQIVGRIGFRGYTKEDLVSEGQGAITLSPSNIVNGRMDYSKCTYISWGKYEESPEIKVNNGDILLVKTGSSYGKCAFVESLFEKATINPQFVVLRHISINPEFLTLILQSQYARKCYNEFVIGTAIPTFTQEKLSNMFIPLPPIYEQNRIISQVSKLMVLISHIAEESLFLFKNIEHVKSKILELAITGKLVPQNP